MVLHAAQSKHSEIKTEGAGCKIQQRLLREWTINRLVRAEQLPSEPDQRQNKHPSRRGGLPFPVYQPADGDNPKQHISPTERPGVHRQLENIPGRIDHLPKDYRVPKFNERHGQPEPDYKGKDAPPS